MKAINIIILAISLIFYPCKILANEDLKNYFNRYTKVYNLPPGLLSAMCFQETAHNLNLPKHMDTNGLWSYGICAVQWGTAKYMGFKGSKEQLQQPKINIQIAAKYLRYWMDKYNNDIKKSLFSYNSGKPIKVIINSDYYDRVYNHWIKGR